MRIPMGDSSPLGRKHFHVYRNFYWVDFSSTPSKL